MKSLYFDSYLTEAYKKYAKELYQVYPIMLFDTSNSKPL